MQCLAPRETAEWRVFSPVPRAGARVTVGPGVGLSYCSRPGDEPRADGSVGRDSRTTHPRQVPRSNLNCTFLVESRRHGGPTRRVQTGVGTVQVKGRGALEHREVEIPSRAHGW